MEGKTFQQREVVNYALSGDAVHIHMQFSVLADHMNDWGLVLLSLVDITAQEAEAHPCTLQHCAALKATNQVFKMDYTHPPTFKGHVLTITHHPNHPARMIIITKHTTKCKHNDVHVTSPVQSM